MLYEKTLRTTSMFMLGDELMHSWIIILYVEFDILIICT